MPRTKTGVDTSVIEIARIIDRRARRDAEIRKEVLLLSRRVHRYWKRIAPVGDPTGQRYVDNFGGPLPKHWNQKDSKAGSYKGGIVNRAMKPKDGLPRRKIAATDWKSGFIEYGTGGKTPTPEFACRAKTAIRFGAMGRVTLTRGISKYNKKTGKGKRGITGILISGRPEGKPARMSKKKTQDSYYEDFQSSKVTPMQGDGVA